MNTGAVRGHDAGVRGLSAGERAALLICECQRSMLDPALAVFPALAREAARLSIVSRLQGLARQFHAAHCPVIYLTLVHVANWHGYESNCRLQALVRRDARMCRGHAAADIDPRLKPEPFDFVIERAGGLTGFHGTRLESLLREQAVKTLVLAGVSLELMIPGTAVEAINRGFSVVVASDCSAAATAEVQQVQLTQLLPMLATVADSILIGASLAVRHVVIGQ